MDARGGGAGAEAGRQPDRAAGARDDGFAAGCLSAGHRWGGRRCAGPSRRSCSRPDRAVDAVAGVVPPGSEEHDALHRGDVSRALATGLRCRSVEETVGDTWEWLQSVGGVLRKRSDRPAVGLDPVVEAKVLGIPPAIAFVCPRPVGAGRAVPRAPEGRACAGGGVNATPTMVAEPPDQRTRAELRWSAQRGRTRTARPVADVPALFTPSLFGPCRQLTERARLRCRYGASATMGGWR